MIYLEIPLSNFKVTTKDDYDIMGVVFFICSRILIFSCEEGALEVQQEVYPSFCLWNKHFEGSCEMLSKHCDVMSISVIYILHLSPVTCFYL